MSTTPLSLDSTSCFISIRDRLLAEKRKLLNYFLSTHLQGNTEALEWRRKFLLQKTIVRDLNNQITSLEVDIKNKDETISQLKRQVKSNLSIDFDQDMSKLLQQISDLEIKLKYDQADVNPWSLSWRTTLKISICQFFRLLRLL